MAITPAVIAPRDVHTTLNYCTIEGNEAPYNYVETPPEGTPRSNIKLNVQPATIHDIRGREDTVGLEKTGFQFVRHVSEEKDFLDEEVIKTSYYREVEELLKKETGAKRVFVFGHTIRRNYDENTPLTSSPLQRVHVDQTFAAGVARVHLHLGEDADRLLKSRVRIINVWRPIGNKVAHYPLATADFFSLDAENDLMTTRHIYPTREGTTFSVRYNPKHKWYFLADQTPEEVTLIKCFDSDVDKARLSPHSAFLDRTSPKDAPDRQSIEVRALVFDSE